MNSNDLTGQRPPSNAPSLRTSVSRRQALRVLGASAGALALGACGASGPRNRELPFATEDFAGASLSAIMRSIFIPEINRLTEDVGEQWAAQANASISFEFAADWRERYTAVAEARKGEDIVELFGNGAHLFSDRLVDLSDLAEELGVTSGGWVSAAKDAALVDGVWRAVPWAYTAHAVNYRQSFLKQVGAETPRTYDDLLDVATRLHEAKLPLAGFSMSPTAPNDSANLAYSMLWSFGGQEVDETGKQVALDSAGTRAALGYYRDLAAVSDQRALTFTEFDNNDAFLAGDIAMTQNAPSIYWRALQEFPDIAADMNHVKYPAGPEGSQQLVEINSLAVMSHCRSVDAATDWIRFSTRPDQLRRRAEISLSFFGPPLVHFLEDPVMPWNSNPKLAGMKGVESGGHLSGWPGPSSKEAELVYKNASIVNMFLHVGNGSETVESAIRLASEELKRVYET